MADIQKQLAEILGILRKQQAEEIKDKAKDVKEKKIKEQMHKKMMQMED